MLSQMGVHLAHLGAMEMEIEDGGWTWTPALINA